jgi:hypothetical protein
VDLVPHAKCEIRQPANQGEQSQLDHICSGRRLTIEAMIQL